MKNAEQDSLTQTLKEVLHSGEPGAMRVARRDLTSEVAISPFPQWFHYFTLHYRFRVQHTVTVDL